MNKNDVLLARKCANDAIAADNPDSKVLALARRLNQALNSIDVLKDQLDRERTIWFNERSGLDSQIRDLKDMLFVAAKIYGEKGEIQLPYSYFLIANAVSGSIAHRNSDGMKIINWGKEVLAVLFVLYALAQPVLADDDEPITYLQPHGTISTMVLWTHGRPRRAIKRGAIVSFASGVAIAVVDACFRRR